MKTYLIKVCLEKNKVSVIKSKRDWNDVPASCKPIK